MEILYEDIRESVSSTSRQLYTPIYCYYLIELAFDGYNNTYIYITSDVDVHGTYLRHFLTFYWNFRINIFGIFTGSKQNLFNAKFNRMKYKIKVKWKKKIIIKLIIGNIIYYNRGNEKKNPFKNGFFFVSGVFALK